MISAERSGRDRAEIEEAHCAHVADRRTHGDVGIVGEEETILATERSNLLRDVT